MTEQQQAPPPKSRSDHLTLDFGEKQIASALASIKRQVKRRNTAVRNIRVHTRSTLWYGNINNGVNLRSPSVSDLCVFLYGFEALCQLPNVRRLTVDLDGGILPVMALTVAINGCKRLKSVVLNRVNLQGDVQDLTALEQALSKHRSLRQITLNHVTGMPAAVMTLTTQKHLQGICVTSTPILGANANANNHNSLQKLCASPYIRTIQLDDVPDLQDRHILGLCHALASSTTLEQFSLCSPCSYGDLGQVAGEAIAHLLLTNQTIQSLKLHLDGRGWDRCGTAMAGVLQRNQTLRSLDLLLYGKTKSSVEADIRRMAQALLHQNHDNNGSSNDDRISHTKNNSPLRELLLSVDLDPMIDDPIEDTIISAFDSMLDTNRTLSYLTVTEYGMLQYPISNASMERKLVFNRSGIPQLLLDGSSPSSSHHHDGDYINAMASQSNHLDLLFYALLNNPSLFTSSSRNNSSATRSRPAAKPSATPLEYHHLPHQSMQQPRQKDGRLIALQQQIQSALDVIDDNDGDDLFLLGNTGESENDNDDALLWKELDSRPLNLPRLFPQKTSSSSSSTRRKAKGKLDGDNNTVAIPKTTVSGKAWRRRVTSSLTGMLSFKA